MGPLAERHRRVQRRRLASRLYRVISHRGMGTAAFGAILLGYSLTIFAATGVPAGLSEHVEFVAWLGGALLLLSGVSVVAVKTFVTPAIEKALSLAAKEHSKDPDAHPAYLKRADYDSRHEQLLDRVDAVGLKVAALRGQLKADRKVEHEKAKEEEEDEG